MEHKKKANGGLTERLERGWEKYFVVIFLVLFVVLIATWHLFKPEFAQFLAYLVGGGFLIWQIRVSSRRATATGKTEELTELVFSSTSQNLRVAKH